jgi:hypothetical protein
VQWPETRRNAGFYWKQSPQWTAVLEEKEKEKEGKETKNNY